MNNDTYDMKTVPSAPPTVKGIENVSTDIVEKEKTKGSSIAASVFNLSNCAIGVATLQIPDVFAKTGIVLGLLLLVLVGIFTGGSLHLIGRLGTVIKKKRYSDLAKEVFGTPGEITIVIFFLLLLHCPFIGYHLVIGDFMTAFYDGASHAGKIYVVPQFMSLLITIVFIYPLTFVKDVGKLAAFSSVCLVCIAYTVLLIVVEFCVHAPTLSFSNLTYFKLNIDIFDCIAVVIMAFCSHTAALEIFNDLIKPTNARKTLVSTLTTIAVIVTYAIVGLSGYLHYQDKVDGIVLQSKDVSEYNAAHYIAFITFSIMLALTYPLMLFPARTYMDWILEKVVQGVKKPWLDRAWSSFTPYKYYVYSFCFVFVPYAIACAQPDVNFVFALFGCLSGSVIMLIFPSLAFMKMKSVLRPTIFENVVIYANLLLGTVLLLGGTAIVFVNNFNSDKNK